MLSGITLQWRRKACPSCCHSWRCTARKQGSCCLATWLAGFRSSLLCGTRVHCVQLHSSALCSVELWPWLETPFMKALFISFFWVFWWATKWKRKFTKSRRSGSCCCSTCCCCGGGSAHRCCLTGNGRRFTGWLGAWMMQSVSAGGAH